MTAPTEAQKAKARYISENHCSHTCPYDYEADCCPECASSAFTEEIAQALADAVTAERAACLLLATKLDNDHDIREAILARDKL